MPVAEQKRLFIVDGNSYAYRSYYAIKNLTTSKGLSVNALFGFARLLFKIHKQYKPEYVAIAFDTKHPTWRHKELESYKAQRQPTPEDLIVQFSLIKELIKAFNIKAFELEGYEADDILMYLTRLGEKKGIPVTILTGDKDMLQLVNKNVRVMSVHKDDYFYTPEKVKEKYGVTPEQMIDYLALAGDSSDNIPGVPGVGEKTAMALLAKFNSLDGVLKHAETIEKEGLKKKITENKGLAILSRKLATLVEPPIKLNIEDLKIPVPDAKALFAFLSLYEFGSMSREARELFAPEDNGESGGLFDEGSISPETHKRVEINGEEGVTQAKKELKTEIAAGFKEGFYTAKSEVGADKYFVFGQKEAAGIYKGRKLVGHDLKDLLNGLAETEEILPETVFDTMLAAYLLNPDKGSYETADIVSAFLGVAVTEEAAVCELFKLKERLSVELEKHKLTYLFEQVEMPLLPVLAEIERSGVKLDIAALKKLSAGMEKKLDALVKKIYDEAGEEFNINSPQQLSKILFDKLKLPVIKKTKTGSSTDVEVLEELASKSMLPGLLLEYRQLSKLKGTYVDALPLLADKGDRVHTHYDQTGAATGRLSSLNPNLQNIPIRTEIGREIRKAFIPSKKGWKIISADYSQIELRILAHFSEDPNMLDAFLKDEDIHTRTAMEIFDLNKEMITADERRIAKTVNFGIVYGITPYGLSRQLKTKPAQAKQYIESYFAKYPGVKSFNLAAIEKAKKTGYVETLLGRRRYVPDVNSKNKMTAEAAQRIAINMPIQGSASDIIKLAMINIYNIMKKEEFEAKMILQVHDELVFDCPPGEVKLLEEVVKKTMESAIKLKVPVKVDISAGDNWSE